MYYSDAITCLFLLFAVLLLKINLDIIHVCIYLPINQNRMGKMRRGHVTYLRVLLIICYLQAQYTDFISQVANVHVELHPLGYQEMQLTM